MLLLDEISNSDDRDTEVLMQDIMSKEIGACTTVAVAHRLKLMTGFVDRLVVLDYEIIVVEGALQELLAMADGAFCSLHQTGR